MAQHRPNMDTKTGMNHSIILVGKDKIPLLAYYNPQYIKGILQSTN